MDTKQLEVDAKVPSQLRELVDAVQVANNAEPVEIADPTTGEKVSSVKVRLSPQHTKMVMSQPPHLRAAMAESILKARADAKEERLDKEAKEGRSKKLSKAKRKARRRAQRRNR